MANEVTNPVITFNISIQNNSGKDVSLDGRLKFVLGNPDHNRIYFGGYRGPYLRTDDIYFSSSSVTISAGSTANFQNLTWKDKDTGLGLGETSPLNPSYLPIFADDGSVAYARNILLYVGGNSSIAVCDNLSPTIIFAQGGTYEINITSYSGEGSSGGDSGGDSGGGGGSSEGGDSGGSGGGSEGGGESGGGESGSDPDETVDKSTKVTVPAIKANIPAALAQALYEKGYRKVRALVVYPSPQDRKVVCQGVANPTLYTNNHRGVKETGVNDSPLRDLYAQASWFFRPKLKSRYGCQPDANAPVSADKEYIPYMENITGVSSYEDSSPENIKRVEIQGCFKDYNKFKVTWKTLTFNSPDIEFEPNMANLDYTSDILSCNPVGNAEITRTMSDIDIQTETPAISDEGGGFVKKSFTRNNPRGIISGLFWDDYAVDDDLSRKKEGETDASECFRSFWDQKASAKWMVYLWNRTGSLNNDIERPANYGVQSATLKQKIISNLRYASSPSWKEFSTKYNYKFHLYSSDENEIIKLKTTKSSFSNFYKGNIDTMLLPDDSDGMYFAIHYASGIFSGADFKDDVNWKTFVQRDENNNDQNAGIWQFSETHWIFSATDSFQKNVGDNYRDLVRKKGNVRLKYKSTPHVVMVQTSDTGQTSNEEDSSLYDDSNLELNSLPIMELKRNFADEGMLFGGTSDDALKENVWIPCGEPVYLWDGAIGSNGDKIFKGITVHYLWGDTYFQRWDCLKTYAYTPEDINQVVEIGSFMLESYINIDGRYDRNRGQLNNLYMSPRNFNLLNPVYSQINNFFSYRRLDEDAYKRKWYPNQITWSKTKTSGAEIDLWTNVTLASVMEMDGDKGTIRKLIRQNNELFSFQDKGIAQVLYNQNVQISATNGTPIEIANSGKVDGKRYFTDSVGCSNKWSMAQTPMGIYFMDSLNKDIFLFNGQLQNLSGTLGFNSWAKQNIPGVTEETMWTPNYYNISTEDGVSVAEQGFNNFVSYQDKLNQDVLFINKDIALAYSEKFGAFTSFYSYGGTPYFCNLDDMGVWVQNFMAEGKNMTRIWKHNGGKYCHFFADGKDATKPYWTILIGNPEPQMDKIFTNLEFRASVDGDGELKNEAGKFSFTLPFDFLETWDEYQHGYTALSERDGHNASLHHTNDNISSLKRKFRMWRCDIPRNNCLLDADRIQGLEYSTDAELGVSRHIRKPNDRMRNPWLYLKLMKQGDTSNRTEIHDLLMTYYV